MELLKVDTLEQAREKLMGYLPADWVKISEVESCRALGKILAEDVVCEQDVPNFRRSMVDGYAVCAKDTMGAGENIPVLLQVIEEVSIGKEALSNISSGTCAYVPTGGMIPDGADACVMVEYCEEVDEETIAVYQSVSANRYIVNIGEDCSRGSILLKKGSFIGPKEIAALAAVGKVRVKVFSPFTMSILSTGDELVSMKEDRKEELGRGKIFDINTHALSALALKHGFEVLEENVIQDDEDLLRDAISRAMKTSDMVVISGGSSKGKKDMTARLVHELSNPGVFTHGIALKPGKPTILGVDGESKTVLIVLPGHPVAAMAVFEMIPVWLKQKLYGEKSTLRISAKLNMNVPGTPGRQMLLFVRLSESEDGCEATPIFGKSGLISTITDANGYALIDLNKEGLKSGENIWVHKF